MGNPITLKKKKKKNKETYLQLPLHWGDTTSLVYLHTSTANNGSTEIVCFSHNTTVFYLVLCY